MQTILEFLFILRSLLRIKAGIVHESVDSPQLVLPVLPPPNAAVV